MADTKRIWRSGVRFDCPECGQLWRDDLDHSETLRAGCPWCGGDTRMVGKGDHIVQWAKWFKCLSCGELAMQRRGEVVRTGARSGFDKFA